ncbi:hypothetical protein ABTA68_20030, partial [Acinetobacter baumannii]
YLLKNHDPLYAALTDIGRIAGLALWRARVRLGKPDSTPPNLLQDSIRHSVFRTGFDLRNVQNPALIDFPMPTPQGQHG